MKALTIHQPWAWAIAMGYKPIENRSWTTPYRGPLLIHAGTSPASLDRGTRILTQRGILVPNPLPTGVIIAIANLTTIIPRTQLPQSLKSWANPHYYYCWVLTEVELIKPRAVRGEQGLFEVPYP